MGFQIAAHTLPSAHDYDAARRPFRFRHEGHRALRDNRSHHLTVRMVGCTTPTA
jgi:hypothetical protein